MPYIDPNIITQAKKIDLLTYLENYEPDELVKLSSKTYTTKTNGSLIISNGKWNWFAQEKGGTSALDYLVKVRGYSFVEAVEKVTSKVATIKPVFQATQYKKAKAEEFILPQKNDNNNQVIKYLKSRGIDNIVTNYCIDKNVLYEDKQYHNAVFVGYDKNNIPQYAMKRGTIYNFLGEVLGSKKEFGFKLVSDKPSNTLNIFESAIDSLSYATIMLYKGYGWKEENYLSLAGVSKSSDKTKEIKFPVALKNYLDNFDNIKTIKIHFDNDKIGKCATRDLTKLLEDKYEIVNEPPKFGKDINDDLKKLLGIKYEKAKLEEPQKER